METYEMEPYVDKSYNEERNKYILTEKFLILVVALRLICSYWGNVDCPNIFLNNMTYEQIKIFKGNLDLAGLVLRIPGLIIFILDILVICKHKRDVYDVILILTWIFVKPLYFFIRGVVLDDEDVIGRGVIESAIYTIILFMYVLGKFDNFISGLCSMG